MSDRLNFPIWADADTNTTGFTLQHLVNGSWVDTDMRTYPMPAGYESEICINRYVEKDIKSTAPDFSYSGTTGITPQPDAYQVYRMDVDGVLTREMGFFNDWSYEMFTGNTRCISAPINRHADARQKLVYGNFAESGNSIIVKPVIVADIKMQPSAITIGAEQYQTITIVVTSNTSFELILPEWLTASQTAFTSGTTVAYLYPQVNTSFDSRQFTIQAKHDAYWSPDYEYTDLAQVTQAGKVAYLTIYPDPLGVAWDTTGLTSVTVYTNTDFTATTNSSDTWLTYSGKTEVGTNYYNVYFNISANTGDYRQTHAYFEYVVDSSGGTQTRASRVVQAKAPDITIEPQSRVIISVAQGIRVQVSSEANWVASTASDWLSVPSSGVSGVTLIFINASENLSEEARSGSVTFSNGARQVVFNVTQGAVANTIRYSSIDDSSITPYNTTGFGANIVSNVYYPNDDYGIITFDGNVTTIGFLAFNTCNTLSSIEIPNTVTSLGPEAFNDCSALTSIDISNITSIDYYGFNECRALSAVTNSSELISLGNGAFRRCSELKTIDIPKVNSIPKSCFYSCNSLSAITVGSGLTSLGNSSFRYCYELKTIDISNVRTIRGYCFAGCRTLSFTVGSGLTQIESHAFENCSALTSIDISNITGVSDYCFANCPSLSSVTVGSGLTRIESHAFENCSALTSINIINVTAVMPYGFYKCKELTSITFGSGLIHIGTSAFEGCTKLGEITFEGSVWMWRNNVTKGTNWSRYVLASVVHCSDGTWPI